MATALVATRMFAKKTLFDIKRELYFDAGTEIKLLKVSDTLNEYDEIDFLVESWFFEYSNFRKNFLLEIAESDIDIGEAIKEATHVRIGDDVYTISAGDTTGPMGTDVTWKIYCDLFTRRGQFAAIY